jgi:serine/threonine protein kinase
LLLRSRDDDSDLVVADFGAAISLPEDGFLISHTVGTVGYIAPEILTQHAYSKPADMWSFGIILYILLCGQFPFEDDSQVLCQEIIFQEAEMSHMSNDASSLLRSLLKRDPAERLTVEQALQHSWMRQPASFLLQRDLSFRVPTLKFFQAKRKFKGGVRAVIATNKFSDIAAKARKEEKVKEGEEGNRLAADMEQPLQPISASTALPPPPPPLKEEEETPFESPGGQEEDLHPTRSLSSTATDPTATVASSSKLSETAKRETCTIQ